MGAFPAILAALSIQYSPAASAQTGAPMVGGVGAGHYAFISRGRPIRIIKN